MISSGIDESWFPRKFLRLLEDVGIVMRKHLNPICFLLTRLKIINTKSIKIVNSTINILKRYKQNKYGEATVI